MNQEEKTKLVKGIVNKSIEAFGIFFFKNHLRLETPKFHKEIYSLFEQDLKRIAIAAPRGHAKSTITDLVYLAWMIVHNKVHFVLLVSDTYSQSVLFLEALKAEFESNDKLKLYYGNLVSKKWREDEIIVNGIMIKAVGAGMKVRGLKFREFRPDLVIVDDLENEELVENKERREKLERWVNAALIPALAKDGKAVFIGTILHYDSLLFKLTGEKTYKEYSKKVYKALTNNEALWTEHLSVEELEKLKAQFIEQGQGYLFYQEYQNDPISDENRKFKIEKIKYFEEKELEGKNLSTFITIDRAYSTAKTADWTGIIVVSVDVENYWYIRLAERFKGTEKELIDKIFDLRSYYKPVRMGIEQKAYEYTLKPYLDEEMRRRDEFFGVQELKDLGRRKTIRIEGLIPRYEIGTIKFKKDQTDLIDELITFPKGVWDDLADALAYQLDMARDPASSKTKTTNAGITYHRG